MKYHLLLIAMLFSAVTTISAQFGQVPAPAEIVTSPVTRTIALKNANIIPSPGQMIEKGTVVIKDGLILAVGKDVKIPIDAKVIDADSMYVYAGFIDGLSHVGITAPQNNQGQGGGGQQAQRAQTQNQPQIDRGNPPNEVAGILPERSVETVVKMDDKSVADLRKLGFTAAHVVPRGNMLPGKGAIVLLNEKSPYLRKDASFFSQLQGSGRMYPSTVIAVMSKYRELYKQAEQAKMHEAMFAKSPKGMERPNYSPTLQAFYPVIDKKQTVFFNAEDVLSIYRVFTLQKDLGFSMVLANVKQGWDHADAIKSKGIPVILSLDLPEEPKTSENAQANNPNGRTPGRLVADRNDQSNSEDAKKEEPKEKVATDPEKEKLEARRKEEMKKYLAQAGVFEKKGIEFGLATTDADSKNIQGNLRKMIENGLTEKAALAALTTTPAKMLGLSDVLGTIEKGKIGNLVVTSKPYFDEKAKVKYVIVDGQLFEYEDEPAAPANRGRRPTGGGTN